MGRGFGSSGSYDPAFSELEHIRRAQEAHRRARARRAAEFSDGFGKKREWEVSPDDRWKDRLIFFTGVVVSVLLSPSSDNEPRTQCLFIGIGPGIWSSTHSANQAHSAASANLAQARSEAREFGAERRQEIRRRVKESQESQERLSSRAEENESGTRT